MKSSTTTHILWLSAMAIASLLTGQAEGVASSSGRPVAKVALQRSPLELDPYAYLSLPEWYVHHNITATLVELDHENQIVPGLAKSMRVADKGRTYYFDLRTDKTWSDGSPITPNDVLASFRSPERHRNAELFPKILRNGPLEEAVFLEKGNTLVIRLAAEYPAFLFQLATVEYGLIDTRALLQTKKITKTTRTSGDYKITELTEELVRIEARTNGAVSAENPQVIEFRYIPDQKKIVELIRRGELDFHEAQSEEILRAGQESGLYQIINGGLDNLATLQARKLNEEEWNTLQVLRRYLDRNLFAKAPKQAATKFVAFSIVAPAKEAPRISAKEARGLLGNTERTLELRLGEDATSDQLEDAETLQKEAAKIGITINLKKGIQGFRSAWEKEDYPLSLVRMGVYAENEAELLHGYFCASFAPYKSIEPLACTEIKAATAAGTPPTKVRKHLAKAYERILESGKGYDLLEVKSGTKVKDEHIPDISFQKWVLEKCGIKVSGCYLVHVNGEYVLEEAFLLKDFFTATIVEKEVQEFSPQIEGFATELKKVLAQKKAPEIPIGRQCSKPYDCEYQDECWANVSIGSVHYLNRVTQKKLDAFLGKEVKTLDQIDEGEKLSALQGCQRLSWVEKEPVINHEGISDFLASIQFPLTHLDFETLNPTIPTIQGMRPYGQYPFQFSIHIEDKTGKITHQECLAEDPDPRRKIAEELVRLIPKKGTLLAYHASFEKVQIRNLGELFPDLSEDLANITERMVDLEKPFTSGDYVDYRFQGSTSIKKVLPVLCPTLSYKDLEVSNGSLAQIEYLRLLKETDPTKKSKIRAALLAYCKRDTEAMVEVLKALRLCVETGRKKAA